MEILDGKTYASEIKAEVKSKVEKFCLQNKTPMLACIIVEGNKASEVYVASKERACKECGFLSKIIRLKQDIQQEELVSQIETLNKDADVSAILLQLPLPSHLDSKKAIYRINPKKDVDCLTYQNLGLVFAGDSNFAPCTASGIIKLIEKYNIQIEGKHVVVVGRSLLVGKSVAILFEQKNATVTICHSKTQNLKELTNTADILVVAIGKAHFITADYVKPSAVVIDVGINRVDGKLLGDVDFGNVKNKCSYITPVPGGVGPLTVACLMENTLTLAQNQKTASIKDLST